ncbi:RHS repeat-associated core domain-containing protein [Algoriphagus yeomjeoni]|uniref:RHS repeat-associated protein n=1 Tax=Algoriphagus yeomjeoni TaxID=291403 RepID=A0A327PBD4_9BACT|nr:RHS repeat-associated core domain-containing protein [Algoriphagus yeomjeoni]RAI88514.1 RHS repeat-associated protein [Algoriphagus yeomjeoni]
MHWLALLVFCGNQTYSYNIRGWLKTLGSSLTDGYTQTNYYQESGATAPRYNGNISRIDWGGKEGSGGAFKTRTYNYIYDHANRLKTANFTASGEANRFNVTGITYDANGNIYSMVRRNQRATSDYNVVDDLEYSYNRFSNRLSQVKDNNLSTNYTAKDFKDWGTAAYGYDENGNMTANVDKEITLITYNHLNLPQEITFESGAQLRFAYDAAGNKLTQKVYNSSGTLTKTQDYIGEIVLLDGALDYLIHEEGRLVAEEDELWGEYYLKDHLGNIRQVLRESESQVYIATMESGSAATEEMAFSMISESRQTEPEHNVTVGGNQVAWLNANRGRMVGPGRTQEIYAGDSLRLQVHGKYLEDKKQKANPASFMAAGGKDRLIADLNELVLSNQRAGGANPIALLNLADILAKDLQSRFLSGGAPEAYLMYALYDQDSNRYEIGKKVLSKNAANQHEVLEENMYISRDGYMETFVVNETSEDVWFDNMMVMSTTPVIVQETHYDPWGLELTGLGYQYGGIKANKYLYNGKELIEDNGLQYYDYGARMYDAAIGRWGVVDPLADHPNQLSSSPYNYGANNPVFHTDPDGKCPPSICGAIIGAGLDYGLQVTENILRNGGQVTLEAFTNIDGTSISTSALAGATGAGLVTKFKKAHTLIRLGVEVASDGGASALNQYVNEGEVDLADVAIDATAGQLVGKGVSNSLKGKAQNSEVAKALQRDADRAQRVADQPKRSPGRQDAKQQKANTAAEKSDSYGDSRAAAAGTASAGAASYTVKKVKEDENK